MFCFKRDNNQKQNNKKWIEQNKIEVLEWLSQSPDSNVIVKTVRWPRKGYAQEMHRQSNRVRMILQEEMAKYCQTAKMCQAEWPLLTKNKCYYKI